MHVVSKAVKQKAGALLKKSIHKRVIFSRGSYQIEFERPEDKENFWVFLQMDREKVTDFFSTSSYEEENDLYLTVALLLIDELDPLHQRFERSFWRALFILCYHEFGTSSLKLDKNTQTFRNAKITINPKEIFTEILEKSNNQENQEFKLSNFTPQEVEQYENGNASESVLFELSYWSDIAKELFMSKDIEIKFSKEGLPDKIEIESSAGSIHISMDHSMYKKLLEYPYRGAVFGIEKHCLKNARIEGMEFNPKEQCIKILKKRVVHQNIVELGGWIWDKEAGFFPKQSDPLLRLDVLKENDLVILLQHYTDIVLQYLPNLKVHRDFAQVSYTLAFDEEGNFRIDQELFSTLEMKNDSFYIGNWVYVEGSGFFRKEKGKFENWHTTIPYSEMDAFISDNKEWLARFPGFGFHITHVETKMSYAVVEEGVIFLPHSTQMKGEGVIDFHHWVYIKGEGFYPKGKRHQEMLFDKETLVPFKGLEAFIYSKSTQLDQIPKFFIEKNQLEKVGLSVFRNADALVQIDPIYSFKPGKEGRILGTYYYVPGEGFGKIPPYQVLPEGYRETKVFKKEEETFALLHELETLKSFIDQIDPTLQRPKNLTLYLNSISKGRKIGEWKVSLSYGSSLGEVNVLEVFEILLEYKQYLSCKAGLIVLSEERFSWLKKKRGRYKLRDATLMKINSLDWIRIHIFDEVDTSRIKSSLEKKYLKELAKMESPTLDKLPNIKGLISELRSYQKIGVSWLWFLYQHGLSGLLCDEMGLGKTHQAMGLLQAVKNKYGARRPLFLIVCPTSVIYHWETVLAKFMPNMRMRLYYGRYRDLSSENIDIILTSYGILRQETKAFQKCRFEVIIFDEMHVAKNRKSQTNKSLTSLKAVMKVGVTGTPLENYLWELKALFDISLPGYLPEEKQFKEEFINPIEKQGDHSQKKVLSALINPFILRRKKSEVLKELPAKMEEKLYVDFSEDQRKFYKKVYEKSKSLLAKESQGESGNSFFLHIFALLNKLKQVANHPALYLKDTQNFESYQSGKWDLFKELLLEARQSGQKVVVFSQYVGMLEIMRLYCQNEEIGFAMIKGATQKRGKEVERFLNDPKCEVFLGSLLAAGTGIDLTSASIVIHYDRWWNPAKEDQATDRVHRIGQQRGVQVFKLITKHSLEESIDDIIEKKKGLITSVLSFDAHEEKKMLNRKEVMEILAKIERDIS